MGESSRKFSLQESLPSGSKAAHIFALLTIHSSFYHSADRLLLTLHKSFTVTEAEECWGNGAWRFREHCWKVVSVCTLSISVIFAHFPEHHVLSFCSCALFCTHKCVKNCMFVKWTLTLIGCLCGLGHIDCELAVERVHSHHARVHWVVGQTLQLVVTPWDVVERFCDIGCSFQNDLLWGSMQQGLDRWHD